MNIYDELINNIESLLNNYQIKEYRCIDKNFKEEPNQIIFKNDVKFELGKAPLYALSGCFLTSKKFDNDSILLIGDELNEIDKDYNYARIVICSIDDSKLENSNQLYQSIRKVDYSRYHLNLDGVNTRVSFLNKCESLLISKNYIKNKGSFQDLGSYMISVYKRNEIVKNCKMIFINKKDFPYSKIEKLISRGENITKTLDHLINKVKMDCHSCSLQVVCNEVEKKVQEDFKEKNNK